MLGDDVPAAGGIGCDSGALRVEAEAAAAPPIGRDPEVSAQ